MEQVALRDLTYFLAVERQGSFGRAATELMVSQPAVSERIRHLERTVGAPLFERSTRGATLTVAGAALLPYARRCSDLASEALDVARSAAGSPPLVLAVHSTFAQRTVPLVLSAIGTTPRRLSIRDAHSEQVPALVADGVADLRPSRQRSPRTRARTAAPRRRGLCRGRGSSASRLAATVDRRSRVLPPCHQRLGRRPHRLPRQAHLHRPRRLAGPLLR